ncbi:enoyl-CoA hydratase-related protein [Nocardioides gilvus]|uniref:enoyl-CoA hydratase-related protein n=1 Tax=Nocardioides gilvus TaxID=1735589 RepID=UPI000D74551D|nr:enoyl-CoA hydratase-related protein [Nocardioides gilvus]
MPQFTKNGPVWVLDLGSDENRFSPRWLAEVDAALDEIASSSEPAVLVTVGSDKFYSNGLDLEWVTANPGELAPYVDRIHAMFAKVLTLPVATVAAVNGHSFGGGAMLAMAHDFRVMRDDRGYFCFPEVDILIPFTEGMAALIQAKLTPQAAIESMTTGRRYGATDAQARGIVDATAPLESLVETAAGLVAPLAGKDRTTLGRIKQVMFADAAATLLTPQRADVSI